MSMLRGLFGRAPSDPGEALIEWLADKSLDDRLIVVGILYGGPYSLKVCKWVLSRPDCDKGTASMVLWEFGWPQGLISGSSDPVSAEVKRELIAFIVERWKAGLFAPAVFEFDPRDNRKAYRRELKKTGLEDPFLIPEDAWEPINGRKPLGSPATDYHAPGSALADLLGALRLADLAVINPKEWEPIRRRSLGLE